MAVRLVHLLLLVEVPVRSRWRSVVLGMVLYQATCLTHPFSFLPFPSTVFEGKSDGGGNNIVSSRGQLIEVDSPFVGWCIAEIVDVSAANNSFRLHYSFHSRRCDEWLVSSSPRLARRGTHLWLRGTPLRVGLKVDWRETNDGRWCQGQIIDIKGARATLGRVVTTAGLGATSAAGGATGASSSSSLSPPAPTAAVTIAISAALFGEFEAETRARVAPAPTKSTFWATRARAPALLIADARSSEAAAFLAALAARGATVVSMGGDGNCLFRAVADQVYGSQALHAVTRGAAADYMRSESTFFRNFVADDDGGWEAYLQGMRAPGTWGDDPEVQALCEIYGRSAEIWAYDPLNGAKELRVFNAGIATETPTTPLTPTTTPIRLSYYGGGHYDSVRGYNWEPALLRSPPGTVERDAIAASARRTAAASGAGAHAHAVLSESDVAATEEAALAAALNISRAAFDATDSLNVEEALELSLSNTNANANSNAVANAVAVAVGGSGTGTGSAASAAYNAYDDDANTRRAIESSAADAEAKALATADAEMVALALASSLRDAGGGGGAAGGGFGMIVEEDDAEKDLRLALELSMGGGRPAGAVTDATLDAAFELTEEEQLQCIYSNTSPQDFVRDKQRHIARIRGKKGA